MRLFNTVFIRCAVMLLSALSATGCGDGALYVDSGSTDTAEAPDETDSRQIVDTVDTQVPEDSETGDTSSADLVHFTVKMQAENYDAFDFKGNERQWIAVTLDSPADQVTPSDAALAETAHGEAFLMALPDLNSSTDGFSVMMNPELSPQVGFDVQLEVAGRYYVWVRAFTTGGADNGIHVGLNGTWPDSGKNIQFPYAANSWTWSSNQRDSGGDTYGLPRTIYLDVDAPGVHRVTFAMREDGFRFDEWIMTTDETRVP